MNKIKPKIIAIVGPTASGKTAVGVELAKEFNGEIVSADSRQIFRGLDLGTGKDLSEYGDIKYHMIDICEPEEEFNLFKYTELANEAIQDILSLGKLPIIVGGTGLYVQALVEGFSLKKQETRNKKQSNSIIQISNSKQYSRTGLEILSIEELQKILKKIDSETFEKLNDKKNPHRLIRAIERAQSGTVMTKIKPEWDVLQIAIDLPREVLNTRIDKRVEDRFKAGMLEEVEGLIKSGVNPNWLLKLGLEYRIITSFLISNSEFLISSQIPIPKFQYQKIKNSPEYGAMKEELKLRSHQYAKRQVTWFKRFPEIILLSNHKEIEKRVKEFIQ